MNRVTRYLLPLIFLAGVMILFIPPVDPDFGWHFKYGQYLVEGGKILRENIYSYTMPDYVWLDSYWLFEAVLYLTHNYLGHIVAGIFFSIILAGFFLNYVKSKSENVETLVLVYASLVFYLASFYVTVRSFFFSSIFLVLLIEVLLHKRGALKFLPLLFLLWANLHADFVLGLFIFGLFVVGEFFKKDSKDFMALKTFAVSCVATLINPFGVKLWTTLFNELSQPIVSFVAEWNPLPVKEFSTLSGALAAFVLLALAAALYFKEKRVLWYLAGAIFFGLFSLKSVYMIRVFVLISLPALIWFVDKFFNFRAEKIVLKFALAFFLIGAISFAQNVYAASDIKLWSKKWGYPYDAVQLLTVSPYEGNMFNSYGWGGYLIWQLPKYKTFIDGRMAAWRDGKTYLRDDYLKMTNDPQNNSELIDMYFGRYSIIYVLDKKESSLTKYLKKKKWRVVLEEGDSALLRVPDKFHGYER